MFLRKREVSLSKGDTTQSSTRCRERRQTEQNRVEANAPQRPTSDDKEVWKAYWKHYGQGWRTEPEIDTKRQEALKKYLAITPNKEEDIYPFKGVQLSRADIEWLLATHEDGCGPVNWDDESQHERKGLDLRGADLRYVNLKLLPLARMCAGLHRDQWLHSSAEQCEAAAVHLERADLRYAHLEGADLHYVHLERADLRSAHLEGADLTKVHLQSADLNSTHLEYADLTHAHLESSYLGSAHLERAILKETHLEGVDLYKAHLEGTVLCGAFFDNATTLNDIVLGNNELGFAYLVDVRWNDVNLAVVNWSTVDTLGDDRIAHQPYTSNGIAKSREMRIDEFRAAVRTNRQLSVVLREQGLNEEADHFAYRAQVLQRTVLRLQGLQPNVRFLQRVRKLSSYVFSLFLDVLAGYGYQPAKTFFWYLLVIGGFASTYALFGHLTPLPDALVFSFMSFHGRGFFPSLSGETNLHNTLVVLAAAEAVIGLFIEISFIATFTQRFFGK